MVRLPSTSRRIRSDAPSISKRAANICASCRRAAYKSETGPRSDRILAASKWRRTPSSSTGSSGVGYAGTSAKASSSSTNE